MKNMLLLALFAAISLFTSAQDNLAGTAKNSNPNPYTKGKWRMPLRQNLGAGINSIEYNDSKVANQSNIDLNLVADYFFKNNWATGMVLNGGVSKRDYSGNVREYSNAYWSATASLLYGQPVKGDRIYWNARAGVGYGSEREKDKTPTNTTTDEKNFWKWEITTGLDIKSCHSDGVFINPYIAYEYLNYDLDGGKENQGHFRIGLSLVSSMTFQEYNRSHKTDDRQKSIYNRGRSFIGYTTEGMWQFGNFKNTPDNTQVTGEGNNNEGHFSLDYNYFVLNSLAVGIMGSYQYLKDKTQGSYETTTTTYSIGPKITAHIPVDNCWRNLFGEAAVAFGAYSSESKSGSTTTYSDKRKKSNYMAGLGYNFVITPHLSFTPVADYVSRIEKNKESDNETETTGLNLRFGFRYMF